MIVVFYAFFEGSSNLAVWFFKLATTCSLALAVASISLFEGRNNFELDSPEPMRSWWQTIFVGMIVFVILVWGVFGLRNWLALDFVTGLRNAFMSDFWKVIVVLVFVSLTGIFVVIRKLQLLFGDLSFKVELGLSCLLVSALGGIGVSELDPWIKALALGVVLVGLILGYSLKVRRAIKAFWR